MSTDKKRVLRQVTGKLNYAQIGIYLIYRGAVSGSTGFIRFFPCTSFINRDTIPDEDILSPKRSLSEVFDIASPSMYFIQECK